MSQEVKNESDMKLLGKKIGSALSGGEIIELIGDVGSGKTTLVKGIAVGLKIYEYVQSPSFTINRVYKGRNDLILSHYDFYRLDDAGIMANELAEVLGDSKTVTVIEWSGVVSGILPTDHMTINIVFSSEDSRLLDFSSGGESSQALVSRIIS